MSLQCAICGITADLKCGGCKTVVYCGKDHQKQHWKNGHRKLCKCFEIKTNEQIGRYIAATRDIKQGEIILREDPLVLGPRVVSAPICLGCNTNLKLKPNELNFYKCSKCRWPLCSKTCETSKLHLIECQQMALKKFQSKINFVEENKLESAYCAIVPLRCLLLKMQNLASYERLMILEDNLEERINSPLYNILKSNLVTFIKVVLELDDFDETTILKVAAILDTNSFEIRLRKEQSKIRAIYLQASMFSHDCLPNTRHIFDENMQIHFIATVDIPKGAIINATYTQPLKSTIDRREHLRQTKCFDCVCTRCSDPTELNTFFGAIICSRCKEGYVVSTEPLNNVAVWQCNTCSHEIPAKQIIWGYRALQKEMEVLSRNSPKEFEEFLSKYNATLHEQNTHVIQIKYALTQLYGNVPGYLLHELPDADLDRKIGLCNDLLQIAELFSPGWSDFRGTLLLDLQEAITMKTKREFDNGLLTKPSAQEELMESMNILQEAVTILKVDPNMCSVLERRVKSLSMEIEL